MLEGSPAIDAGENQNCPLHDQRGVFRPQDGNGDKLPGCDLGAYELEGPPVSPTRVVINGQSSGYTGRSYLFIAESDPITSSLPMTYTWETDAYPQISHISGLTDTINLNWEVSGTHRITVTSSNSFGNVIDDYTIKTTDLSYIYLPHVYKKYSSWVIIMEEDFEGDFPGSWQLEDNYGSGIYYWGKRDCLVFSGNYSGWAIGGGQDGQALPCGSIYPYDTDSWMIYGPFNLEDAKDAFLSFNVWVNSEKIYDQFCYMASTDNVSYAQICLSGSTGGWINRTFSLNDVPYLGNLLGEPEVWIAFYFYSDYLVNAGDGAYIDDITLAKCTAEWCRFNSSSQTVVSESENWIVNQGMIEK